MTGHVHWTVLDMSAGTTGRTTTPFRGCPVQSLCPRTTTTERRASMTTKRVPLTDLAIEAVILLTAMLWFIR
jgi:hypothetical protein